MSNLFFIDSHNLALEKFTGTGTQPDTSLAVDGLLDTCAVFMAGSSQAWGLDLGEFRKIELVCLCIRDNLKRITIFVR
jgi:hypothetical protein